MTKKYTKFLMSYFILFLMMCGTVVNYSIIAEKNEANEKLKRAERIWGSNREIIELITGVNLYNGEKQNGRKIEYLKAEYLYMIDEYLKGEGLDYYHSEIYYNGRYEEILTSTPRGTLSEAAKKQFYIEVNDLNRKAIEEKYCTYVEDEEETMVYIKKIMYSDQISIYTAIGKSVMSLDKEIGEEVTDIFKGGIMTVLIVIPFFIIFNLKEKETRKIGMTDTLTNLYNRKIYEIIVGELSRYKGAKWIIFYYDLDGLKKINDTLGHKVGDIYIRTFAETIQKVFREEDYKMRIGGDEFLVVGRIAKSKNIELLEKRMQFEAEKNNLLYSYGKLIFNGKEVKNKEELMKKIEQADKEMYKDKKTKARFRKSMLM